MVVDDLDRVEPQQSLGAAVVSPPPRLHPRLERSHFLRAVARSDVVLRRVLGGVRLDHRRTTSRMGSIQSLTMFQASRPTAG